MRSKNKMADQQAFASLSTSGSRSVTFQVSSQYWNLRNIILPPCSNIIPGVNRLSRLQFCAGLCELRPILYCCKNRCTSLSKCCKSKRFITNVLVVVSSMK